VGVNGETTLIKLVHSCDRYKSNDVVAMCNLLISCGVDVNAKNSVGEAAIHKAHKNKSILMSLLRSGADAQVLEIGPVHWTREELRPVYHSLLGHYLFPTYENEDEAFKEFALLVEANHEDGGATALQIACEHGSANVVISLLSDGADPFVRNSKGKTTLMLVNSAEAAKALIDYGVDVNAVDTDGSTALHFFLYRFGGHFGISPNRAEEYAEVYAHMMVLLEAGANVKKRNKHKQSALMQFSNEEASEIDYDDWSFDGRDPGTFLEFLSTLQHTMYHYSKKKVAFMK